ncbi:hypothetical protein M8C21_010731, partial [Ambrosia artemisiifolia]
MAAAMVFTFVPVLPLYFMAMVFTFVPVLPDRNRQRGVACCCQRLRPSLAVAFQIEWQPLAVVEIPVGRNGEIVRRQPVSSSISYQQFAIDALHRTPLPIPPHSSRLSIFSRLFRPGYLLSLDVGRLPQPLPPKFIPIQSLPPHLNRSPFLLLKRESLKSSAIGAMNGWWSLIFITFFVFCDRVLTGAQNGNGCWWLLFVLVVRSVAVLSFFVPFMHVLP